MLKLTFNICTPITEEEKKKRDRDSTNLEVWKNGAAVPLRAPRSTLDFVDLHSWHEKT